MCTFYIFRFSEGVLSKGILRIVPAKALKKPEIKINFLMPQVQRTLTEHPFGRILNNFY
jgi:hypothetical protein